MSTYSKLSSYNRFVDKKYDREGNKLLFLVPHCTSGNINSTGKNVVDWFCTNNQNNSVNYAIGGKGDIAGCIPEEYGAWTTSSSYVDKRGITFEIASANTYPYLMNNEAVEGWLKLSVDICQRYGKTRVLWLGSREKTEAWANANPPANEIAIVVHRWYANKSCPGDHFFNNIQGLVDELNRRLGNNIKINPQNYSNSEFLTLIKNQVVKIAPKYNIKCNSVPIAQAILESGWGKSNKAKYFNFFGLKYREGRLTCHNGTFVDGSSEQLPDGSYVPITDQWYSFDNIEKGVEGYFQFINIDRYKNLKNVTDWKVYIQNIKADGYATSLSYVDSITRIIEQYKLYQYDTVKPVEPVKPVVTTVKIYFQAGAYSNKTYLNSFVSKLNKLGIKTVVFAEGGLFKIGITDKADEAKLKANKISYFKKEISVTAV